MIVSQRSSDTDVKYVDAVWMSMAALRRAYRGRVTFDRLGEQADHARLTLVFLSSAFLDEYDLFLDHIVASQIIPIRCQRVRLIDTPFADIQVIPREKPSMHDYASLDAAAYDVVEEITIVFMKLVKELGI